MAKKPSIDFKKLIVQKGEKFGFYACAGLLVLLIGLGGMKAASSSSTAEYAREFQKGATAIDTKITSGGGEPLKPEVMVIKDAKMQDLSFEDNRTYNTWFNQVDTVQRRRAAPKVYPPTEAVAEFVRGSIGVYEMIRDPATDTIKIGVLLDKKPTMNLAPLIRRVVKAKGKGGQPAPSAPKAAPTPPAANPPGTPGAAPPPPAPGAGGRGGRGGPPGMGADSANEQGVEYLDIDSKQLDQARWAETILPVRMAVVTGTVPFRKQVEEYAAKLRYRNVHEIATTDLPVYKGYNVERAVVAANGKPVDDPVWERIDFKEMLQELYVIRLVDTEPESYEKDRSLNAAYLERIVPEEHHKLLLPLPKLVRGQYHPVDLKTVDEALKKIKDEGELPKRPSNRLTNQLEGEFNPFSRSGGTPQGGARAGEGAGGGEPGRGRPSPSGGRPIPGGPTPPGAPGAPAQVSNPEEAWLFRFVDITIEPGRVYRYRIQLRAANPNYKKPAAELAYPGLAENEELDPSAWFEVPNDVTVSREENVYVAAGAGDERAKVSSERLSTTDETAVQVQRWMDYVRLPNERQAEPLGEWVTTDIKAVRGQYLGETALVKIPLWSIVNGQFLLREQKGKVPGMRRGDVRWPLPMEPVPQMIVVDFEGGRGTYTVNRRQILDTSSMDMLLYGDDGKLQVYRSMADVKDDTRLKREAVWKKWVDEVELATKMKQQAAGGGNRPGGPGGGGDRPPTGPGG